MAKVVFSNEASDQLKLLPAAIVGRMDKLVARLESWPNLSGVKHLKGNLAGKHRLRTGDYRMQFRVEQTKRLIKANRSVKGRVVVVEEEVVEYRVIVEKVGHRDGFYEE